MFDLLITNVKIVAGSGNPWFKADLGIKDSRIVKIGFMKDVKAKRTIDAEGLFLSPGFIDIHTHSDIPHLTYPQAENYVKQGVTTIVFPNCGTGLAPLNETLIKELLVSNPQLNDVGLDWETFDEYLKKQEMIGTSVNIAPLIGFGTVRRFVMGYEMRAPTRDELRRMKHEVEKAMRAGAFGLTTGLRYDPQSYASTDEVIELARVVARYGGFYTTHQRDEGDRDDPLGSVMEVMEIGEKANLPVNISHFEILVKHHWDNLEEEIRLIEDARDRGVDVTADQYPYTGSGTSPISWIPPWANEGGIGALARRLKDVNTSRQIKEGLTQVTDWRGGPDTVLIRSFPLNDSYVGKTISEVAKETGGDPYEVYFNLLKDHVEKFVNGDISGSFGVVDFCLFDDNVNTIMQKPWVMHSSDGRSHKRWNEVGVHPRWYGTFPRVLGRYVRDRKIISLEEAVRKMTSFPAQRIGIFDRGLIAKGMWADLTIFDPEKIIDKAKWTPQRDVMQYPEGIPYVIVNGTVTVDDGEYTGALGGKIIRKK
jgi:N-acyl-D-amino-acid deacylase